MQKIKLLAGEKKVCAIVKSNAYGHGMMRSAKMLASHTDYFGVGNVSEANRVAVLGVPVLIMLPVRKISKFDNCEYTVTSNSDIAHLEAQAAVARRVIKVHLKIDTGFNRLGVRASCAATACEAIAASPHLRLVGVCTHFASSQGWHFKRQLAVFNKVIYALNLNDDDVLIHSASSTHLAIKNCNFGNMVRVGIALYGGIEGFVPVKSVHAKVISVKRALKGSRISYGGAYKLKHSATLAVVHIGYADGLLRSFAKRGFLFIDGVPAKIVGKICMNMCIIDVSGMRVQAGDLAEVYGVFQGVDAVAHAAGTINYEVLCKL